MVFCQGDTLGVELKLRHTDSICASIALGNGSRSLQNPRGGMQIVWVILASFWWHFKTISFGKSLKEDAFNLPWKSPEIYWGLLGTM